jgi:hypothetical protein
MAEYKVTTVTATNLNGNLNVTTDSSATTNYLTFVDSTTTGNKSVKVSGNSPTFIPSSGNLAIQGTLYAGSGGINVTGTTESTSTSTGAILNAGGMGVAKSIFSGNNIVTTGGSFYSDNVSTAGTARGLLHFRESNSLDRWSFGTADQETGSNVGSNYYIWRYDDSGNYLDSPLWINRSTGAVRISDALLFSNSVSGYNASNLTYYEETTFSSTFTNNGLTTGTVNFKVTRIGNVVTLTQTTDGATTSNYSASGAGYFVSNSALPARFRPSYVQTVCAIGVNSGASVIIDIVIQNTGYIWIRLAPASSFSASGTIGWWGVPCTWLV